jgi:hypothetical protein
MAFMPSRLSTRVVAPRTFGEARLVAAAPRAGGDRDAEVRTMHATVMMVRMAAGSLLAGRLLPIDPESRILDFSISSRSRMAGSNRTISAGAANSDQRF